MVNKPIYTGTEYAREIAASLKIRGFDPNKPAPSQTLADIYLSNSRLYYWPNETPEHFAARAWREWVNMPKDERERLRNAPKCWGCGEILGLDGRTELCVACQRYEEDAHHHIQQLNESLSPMGESWGE